MRFMGPDEDGVVALLMTPGPGLGLVDIFAAGASPSDAASPPKGGGKGAEGGEYSGT
jgi:hypothetical protein